MKKVKPLSQKNVTKKFMSMTMSCEVNNGKKKMLNVNKFS